MLTTQSMVNAENGLISMSGVDFEFSNNIRETQKPIQGQEFETLEKAYDFYNAYAKSVGFSIRIDGGIRKSKTNEWTWRAFVCYKEGKTNPCNEKKLKVAEKNEVRKRGVTRCDCKAKMNVLQNKENSSFRVTVFVEDHNHPLTSPSKVHLLRSQRKVSHVVRSLVDDFDVANVPISQQFRLIAHQSGGIQNVGFIDQDIRNYKRTKREDLKGHDAECLREYFTSKKEEDPNFYFEFDKDEENRMTRCFWVDSKARNSYKIFGDVVVFDTTYNTNEFCMILIAPLVGVNHHGQTIVFGCAFLSNETTESFVWLFNQWINALPDCQPKVIITDQDLAMKEAIGLVFPQSVHRFCIWHIMNKFPEKLGPDATSKYHAYFKASVYNSETVKEFETSWTDALQKSGLVNNEWLRLMYSIRARWVPAYLNDHFHAGMSSSQRSESSHSFFKKYIDRKNSLMVFIVRFNLALDHQRHEELKADYIDTNESQKLLTRLPMEEKMRGVYTRKMFHMYQKEVSESDVYYPTLLRENRFQCLYSIQRYVLFGSKVRLLVHDKVTKISKCSCKKFEFEGIPCRHIISVLRVNGIFYLPKEYVLHRWTQKARFKISRDEDYMLELEDTSLLIKKTKLCQLWSLALNEALLSNKGAQYLHSLLESSIGHIKGLGDDLNDEEALITNNLCNEEVLHEPYMVRAKGCGKRIKSSKEKAMRKLRRCRQCNQHGASHDTRNCPNVNNL